MRLPTQFTALFAFSLFSSLCYLVTAAQDFYKLLGISRDATVKEIKKAYRQKSLEFHPDKNKDEKAAEMFAQIARAYEVLSDEEKRKVYNRYGEDGLKQHEQQAGMQEGFGGGGFDDIVSNFVFVVLKVWQRCDRCYLSGLTTSSLVFLFIMQ
jgi:DnaJ-class molecular chaperone